MSYSAAKPLIGRTSKDLVAVAEFRRPEYIPPRYTRFLQRRIDVVELEFPVVVKLVGYDADDIELNSDRLLGVHVRCQGHAEQDNTNTDDPHVQDSHDVLLWMSAHLPGLGPTLPLG